MASENYKDQLKWFTKKLLEMRRFQEGFASSIDFDPNILSSVVTPPFDMIKRTPEECVTQMLREIRSHLKTKGLITPPEATELFWNKKENGNIEIEGYTSIILGNYLRSEFKESPCAFKEGLDNEGKTIITYNGKKTDVPLRGGSLALFRILLNKFDKEVTYIELFNAMRTMKNLLLGQSLQTNQTRHLNDTQKATVYAAVKTLDKKLREATGFSEFPEIIETVRGSGYKMII